MAPITVPPQPSTAQQSSSSGGSDVEGNTTAKGMIKQILLSKSLSTVLSKVQQMESVHCSASGLAEFSPFAFLSADSVIKTPSLVPAEVTIPDRVLKELETVTPSPGVVTPLAPADYQTYSSPLLCFSSYRLNPAFRNGDKVSLGSPTYSNKLDPNKIMCKFELTGVCNDPKCTAQHLRDLTMSKEDLVKDLISYAPTLAGCTNEEILTATEPAENIAEKVSSYSSQLLEKYGEKVSAEELYKIVVHDANTERLRNKTRTEFVHFDDQLWMGVAGVGPVKSLPVARIGRVEEGVVDPTDIGPEVGVVLVSPPARVDERRY